MAVATRKTNVAALTAELKAFGLKVGAETIGVAPVGRFAPAPVGFKPTDMLPGAKSVVAFVVPQLDGYCDSAPSMSYQQFGYFFKNLYIDRIAWEIARFLDDRGYWALPYCREGQTTSQAEGMNPNPFTERNYRDKEKAPKIKMAMRGDISMRKSAEAAGLGRIGVNGLLLTPEYGPRNRMGLCITTAELDPSPLVPEEICNNCFACVKECPGQAISESGPSEFNPVRCSLRVMGRVGETYENALKLAVSRAQMTWDDETRLRGDARFTVYHNFVSTGRCGTRCVNACPIGRNKSAKAIHALTGSALKKKAKELGADIVGIASAERLRDEPEGFRPVDLLPGAKSVITVGIRQLPTYMETAPDAPYAMYGYRQKNDQINSVLWNVSRLIEKAGFAAMPIEAYGEGELVVDTSALPGRAERKMKARAQIKGSFSHVRAAVQAGLGEVGLNGQLLSPDYGPRVHLGSIVTTAPLAADPLFKGKVCLGEACNKCVDACPAKAIGAGGKLSDIDCLIALDSLTTNYDDTVRKMLDEQSKESVQKRAAWAIGYTDFAGIGYCGIPCTNVCPVGKKELK
jgi:epoxyqueuosine reductase QueG